MKSTFSFFATGDCGLPDSERKPLGDYLGETLQFFNRYYPGDSYGLAVARSFTCEEGFNCLIETIKKQHNYNCANTTIMIAVKSEEMEQLAKRLKDLLFEEKESFFRSEQTNFIFCITTFVCTSIKEYETHLAYFWGCSTGLSGMSSKNDVYIIKPDNPFSLL